MNQPKFKLGDKLTILMTGNQIILNRIDSRNGYLLYQDAYREFELELYTEPKNKKLFAFEDMRDGEIKFYSQEIDENDFECDNYKRVPCFDINYSDKE